MDKRPKNPRVKKRLIKDFGEEHHNSSGADGATRTKEESISNSNSYHLREHIDTIGADGATETKEQNVSNSKFYHLRDLPKKIYLTGDDDGADGESNEDFSPVVSEYIPSPERINHVSTPSSSLGGDSEYIEAFQSTISRTPSTVSNISFVLSQIDFVASPTEVFLTDNNNSSFTTPTSKNLKKNHGETFNIVDITLKPNRPFDHQDQICSANFTSQPTRANSSPEKSILTCKQTNMRFNELDTTLKPEEISAIDLTLRSSNDSSSGLDSIDSRVNDNLPLIVSSSSKTQNGLSSPIRSAAPIIVLPTNVDLRNKEAAPETIISCNVDLQKEVPSKIVVSTDIEPEKDLHVSKIVMSHNDYGSHEIPVFEPNAEPKRKVPAPEFIMPSNVEPKKYVSASQVVVYSKTDPIRNNVPVPEIVVSSCAKTVKELSTFEIKVPSNANVTIIEPSKAKVAVLETNASINAEPVEKVPISEIIVASNAEPIKKVTDHEIAVPSYADIPIHEIVMPSDTGPARKANNTSPELIMLPNDDPGKEEAALETAILSNIDLQKKTPVHKIIEPSTYDKPKKDLPESIVSNKDSESRDITASETKAEPGREVHVPEIVMPSNVEPKPDLPASQAVESSSTDPVQNCVPVPKIVVSSPEIRLPSNADVANIMTPNAEVPVLEIDASTNAEPLEDIPAPEIMVPSNADIPVPSNSEAARNGDDISNPDIVLPSNEVYVNDRSAPMIAIPFTSAAGNHAPSSDYDNEPTKKRTRKRKLDVENWQCKKSKKLKDSGLAYKGCRSKKEHPAKTLGPSCTCKKACGERISPEKRKEIFDKFYKIGNHELQWQFILRNIQAQDIKRTTINRKCNRTQTLKYYFLIDGVKELVCKNFFLNTLQISDTMVFTALEKVKYDESLADLRGCHNNRPHKTGSSTEESVVQHIKLFPTVEAHYVRKDSQKLYLYDDLNISKMYRLYKQWFSEQDNYQDVKMASARQYRKIFNTQFNYSFFKPKKDQCATCTRYERADDDTKKAMQVNYDMHIKNKETVRNIKETEKEKASDSETIAIFDLEKVLYIPKSEVGVFYYKRKYPVYNLTVFDAGRKLGYCFMWHHAIAKRGAIEIGSCIFKFLESEYIRSINKISLYSDGCRGQNKNRFIFALYLYAATKFQMNITHRFFVTGHSQNEGDSMHACVERELKKNKFIYSPEQMYGIAMNAKVTGEKYNVVEMNQSDFLNIKLLIEGQNWMHDSNGNKVMWSNIMEVNACHTEPGKLKFKYSFEDEYLELETRALPSRVRRRVQSTRGGRARFERAGNGHVVSTYSTAESATLPELQGAYNEPVPVSKALYSDLLSLCNSHDIPQYYHDFYKSLACGTDEAAEVQDPLQESSL